METVNVYVYKNSYGEYRVHPAVVVLEAAASFASSTPPTSR
jgi:hypothetical protein